jgi:hypothetical protein
MGLYPPSTKLANSPGVQRSTLFLGHTQELLKDTLAAGKLHAYVPSAHIGFSILQECLRVGASFVLLSKVPLR